MVVAFMPRPKGLNQNFPDRSAVPRYEEKGDAEKKKKKKNEKRRS